MQREDIDLVKAALDGAVDESDLDGLLEILQASVVACKAAGMRYPQMMAAFADGDRPLSQATTVDELLAGWVEMMSASVVGACDGKSIGQLQVIASVLEFAGGTAISLGLPLAHAVKIMGSCHEELMAAVERAQAAPAPTFQASPLGSGGK